MTAGDNRETALKLLLGLADGVDPASVTPDFTWWVQGRGEKTLAEFSEALAAAASQRTGPPRYGVRGVTSEGDRVAIELEGLTPLTGGRLYNNCYHFLVAFRDGVPCGVREYYNTAYAADTFAGGGVLVAVNQPHDEEDSDPDLGGATVEERKALALQLVEISAAGGVPTDLVTPDVVWWVPGRGSMSLAVIQDVVAKFGKVWGGPGQIDLVGVTAEGTCVALEYESRIPLADGRIYNNSYHLLAKFRGNKIRQIREYNDSRYYREMFSGIAAGQLYD